MSLINGGSLTESEKKKIKDFVNEALSTFQEIEDRRGALTDLGKVLSEELGIKNTLLMKAARAAYKQSLEDDRESMDTIEELLVAAGRA